MSKSRIFYYFILILMEFFLSAFFIVFIIRKSYYQPDLNSEEYRFVIRAMLKGLIILSNIIIAFKLSPNSSRRIKLLLGLTSGISIIIYFSLTSHFVMGGIPEYILIVLTVLGYGLQIFLIELSLRFNRSKIRQAKE